MGYLSSHLKEQVVLDITGLLAVVGHLVWERGSKARRSESRLEGCAGGFRYLSQDQRLTSKLRNAIEGWESRNQRRISLGARFARYPRRSAMGLEGRVRISSSIWTAGASLRRKILTIWERSNNGPQK